jgi:hypothetical protein
VTSEDVVFLSLVPISVEMSSWYTSNTKKQLVNGQIWDIALSQI